jgi:transposase
LRGGALRDEAIFSDEQECKNTLFKFLLQTAGGAAAGVSAPSLPWSNDAAKGQVNQLKPMMKHRIYGRANFDLFGRCLRECLLFLDPIHEICGRAIFRY